jgi:uncharacterized protein YecE (DUF72 family)
MSDLRIGTSGWIYRHWRGAFYPPGLPQSRWFDYYGQRFSTTEINGTFYRLPSQAAAARWREAAPPGFLFAWKASRFITHMKRLREAQTSLQRIYAPMEAIGDKLGPCLFQLPPQMALDLPRLKDFLALLPAHRRHVVEFRNPSWYADSVFEALDARQVALCISDHHHAPAPWIVTAPFVYIRGHGPGGRYSGAYSDEDLSLWADKIEPWRAEGRDVFAYFDNDLGCAAPYDAARLLARLGVRPATTP